MNFLKYLNASWEEPNAELEEKVEVAEFDVPDIYYEFRH